MCQDDPSCGTFRTTWGGVRVNLLPGTVEGGGGDRVGWSALPICRGSKVPLAPGRRGWGLWLPRNGPHPSLCLPGAGPRKAGVGAGGHGLPRKGRCFSWAGAGAPEAALLLSEPHSLPECGFWESRGAHASRLPETVRGLTFWDLWGPGRLSKHGGDRWPLFLSASSGISPTWGQGQVGADGLHREGTLGSWTINKTASIY